jgi:hypothetical protein
MAVSSSSKVKATLADFEPPVGRGSLFLHKFMAGNVGYGRIGSNKPLRGRTWGQTIYTLVVICYRSWRMGDVEIQHDDG